MSKTYNLFIDTDGLLYPHAVNVRADELGEDIDHVLAEVAEKGFARYGGGGSPLFHVERCTDPTESIDDVTPRYEVESLTAFA